MDYILTRAFLGTTLKTFLKNVLLSLVTRHGSLVTIQGLWTTLTAGANNGWNSLMGIWGGSTPTSQTGPLASDPYIAADSTSGSPAGVPQEPETIPTFNPFESRIWSPNASAGGTGWNIPTSAPNSPADDTTNNNNNN